LSSSKNKNAIAESKALKHLLACNGIQKIKKTA